MSETMSSESTCVAVTRVEPNSRSYMGEPVEYPYRARVENEFVLLLPEPLVVGKKYVVSVRRAE